MSPQVVSHEQSPSRLLANDVVADDPIRTHKNNNVVIITGVSVLTVAVLICLTFWSTSGREKAKQQPENVIEPKLAEELPDDTSKQLKKFDEPLPPVELPQPIAKVKTLGLKESILLTGLESQGFKFEITNAKDNRRLYTDSNARLHLAVEGEPNDLVIVSINGSVKDLLYEPKPNQLPRLERFEAAMRTAVAVTQTSLVDDFQPFFTDGIFKVLLRNEDHAVVRRGFILGLGKANVLGTNGDLDVEYVACILRAATE